VAHDIEEREPENGPVLPEEAIGDPATDQGKEVNADDEGVKDLLGQPGALSFRRVEQQ
jgi:hypothetical protein